VEHANEGRGAKVGRLLCYSASSERKLLLHKLMSIVMSAIVIALYRAIRVVCLHDVSMIAIGVEGADQGERTHLTTTWHLGCPYPMNRHMLYIDTNCLCNVRPCVTGHPA
jgi:hypothetical protein